MDITALALPGCSVNAICCSHVLEHVSDDRAAMRERTRLFGQHDHVCRYGADTRERLVEA